MLKPLKYEIMTALSVTQSQKQAIDGRRYYEKGNSKKIISLHIKVIQKHFLLSQSVANGGNLLCRNIFLIFELVALI